MKTVSFLLLLITLVFQQQPPMSVFHSSVPVETVDVSPLTDDYPFDNALRIFAVEGEIVPYPENFVNIYDIVRLDEQRLLISHSPEKYRVEDWTFDLATRQFAPLVSACPDNDYYFNPNNPWTIINEGNTWVLCHKITGAKGPALPENYVWLVEDGWGYNPQVTTSPSGDYVVFMGQVGLEQQSRDLRSIELFSYSPTTQKILSLGIVGGPEIYFGEWAEPQVTILSGNSTSIGYMSVSVADATRADSLEFAIGGHNSPSFMDNPPRYVLSFDAPNSPAFCGKSVYDIQSRTLTTYDLDGLCRPEYGDIDSVGYYRDVPFGESYECCDPVPAEVAEVPVVRYDTRTGERKELYRGEVEQIEWVSPDERYAVLLLDSSGQIDFFPYVHSPIYRPLQSPLRVLVDLESNTLAAVTLADEFMNYYWQRGYWDPKWSKLHPIIPISDAELIMIECRDGATDCGDYGQSAVSILLTDTGIQETVLIKSGAIPLLTPDKKGIYVWANPREFGTDISTQGINIYNLETGQITPLTQEFDVEQYSFELVDRLDSTLVRFHSRADGISTEYIVKFKADGSPYVELQRPAESAIGEYVCFVTAVTGLNIRAEANAESERIGTAEAGQRLLAAGKVNGWWQLVQGSFISGELVKPSRACDTLP